MKVVILTRVSKESQSYERQITDLRAYANNKNFEIVGEFNEKISGATLNELRPALNQLMCLVETQKINKILVWELSRLGRNTLEVLKSLDLFHSRGISLYVLNYNIETLNEDGTVNPMAQMMVTMLAEFSRAERSAIQQRLASGYKKHRENNGRVGRLKGASMDNSVLLEKHNTIVKLLRKGRSIREIAAISSKSTRTVQKIKRALYSELPD
jgi:DNA invertase Pin-like site-specific DNA recombinase